MLCQGMGEHGGGGGVGGWVSVGVRCLLLRALVYFGDTKHHLNADLR